MNTAIIIYDLKKTISVLEVLAKHTEVSQFVTLQFLAIEIDRLNNIIEGLQNETICQCASK